MYPASATMELMTHAKTSVAVMRLGGTEPTSRRRPMVMKPVRSAIPMPSMTVRTGPSGAKLMKLLTALRNIQRMPSALSRLWTVLSSAVPERCMISASAPEKSAETTTTMAVMMTKSVSGSGSLLPAAAMRSRARTTKLFLISSGVGDCGGGVADELMTGPGKYKKS